MRVLLCILIFCLSYTYAANIYEWKDAQGNVTFSDTPRPGAKKLDIPDAQTYVPEQVAPLPTIQKTNNDEPTKTASYYSTVIVASPRNNTTVPNRSGEVNVLIEVTPSLKAKDKIQLIMDGKPVGEPQHSTIFKMNNVDRGIHTLSAAIIGAKGEAILTSESITFYILRPGKLSAALKANAPLPIGVPFPKERPNSQEKGKQKIVNQS